MLNIGLDFDDTFTAAPELFAAFVKHAQDLGHVVFVTTARYENNVADIKAALPGVEIIASNGKLKKPAAADYGVSIDIWVDDMPEIIGG